MAPNLTAASRIPVIAWAASEPWQQVNASFRHHLDLHASRIGRLHRLALAIARALAVLDPIMAALCAATCPACDNNCCLRATVWFDFRDLLFLHLAQATIAPGQPMTAPGQKCRYLGPAGCRLPRHRRPFVCTWYLCPDQKIILEADPEMKMAAEQQLEFIKRTRQALEFSFIRLVWGSRSTPPLDGHRPDGLSST